MNLTLKQLFKSVAVCLCACALSAVATDYVSDSFETTDSHPGVDGSYGLAIGEYKTTTYTVGVQDYTNYLWYAAEGDASTIISNDAAYADIEGDGPISNTTAELILNLETEGNTLSRTAGVSFADAPAYIDTLIQFTPSEDDPEINMADVKVALYVNAQSNLVVVHTFYEGGTTPVVTNSVLDSVGTIDPDAWYRLSMEVSTNALALPATKIFLDGTMITHANAYQAGTYEVGGEWFVNSDSAYDIDMISFQGTGLLDELVVSDEAPNFEVPAAIMLTLVGIGDVTFDPAGPVETGTEVTITANADWYVISSLTGPAAFTTDASGLLPADSIVTTLTATASCTVTADTAVVSGGNIDLGMGAIYPLGDVAAWATAFGVTEAEVGNGDAEDDYLLNVDYDTNAGIVIDSITIDGTTVTIDISVTDTDVELATINGTLKLYSDTAVDGDFTTLAATVNVTGADDTVQVDITGIANPTDFFKAVVE